MNRDLRFSASAFGLGAGIFFVGYSLFEVPSNLVLARFGARKWIARIMITWGVIASMMMLVRTPAQFYGLRFLLGIAEAGFFPGIVYYLSQWFPTAHRGRAGSRFMMAIPLSGVVGGTLGGFLLGLNGRLGLAGWQWLFLIEGIPSVLLGVAVFLWLTDKPAEAAWLTPAQRTWLAERLERDRIESPAQHGLAPLAALAQPMIWTLGLPYFLILATGYGYTFWSPTVIRDTLHTTSTQTALITGLFAACSAVAMLIVGASSDRTGERCYHAAGSATLLAFGYFGAAILPNPIARIVALGLVLVGANCFLAPFWCLPSRLLSGSSAAVGIALINAIGNTGGFLGPYSIGLAKDATGGNTGAFLTFSVLGLLAAVLCILLRRRPQFAVRRQQAMAV